MTRNVVTGKESQLSGKDSESSFPPVEFKVRV